MIVSACVDNLTGRVRGLTLASNSFADEQILGLLTRMITTPGVLGELNFPGDARPIRFRLGVETEGQDGEDRSGCGQ